jgi:hypothetical protein
MKEPWQLELERTVHFLNTMTDVQSTKLWAVLTALRGPDSDDSYEKLATTAVIRHAIGLRSYVAGAVVIADSAEYATTRMLRFPIVLNHLGNLSLRNWEHFSFHAKNAFDVLGLSWTEANPKEKP